MPKDLFTRSRLRGHALAVSAWGLALGLRYSLAHWSPPGFPYLTFFPAVVLVDLDRLAVAALWRPTPLSARLCGGGLRNDRGRSGARGRL